MLGRPDQHGQRDRKIIVLPHRADIDFSGLLVLDFELGQLVEAAPKVRVLREANLVGLKFAEQEIEQVSPPDGKDWDGAVLHLPHDLLRSLAMPADMKPDQPSAEYLIENFGVRVIAADIGHDQGAAVKSAIHLRKLVGQCPSILALWQFIAVRNSR